MDLTDDWPSEPTRTVTIPPPPAKSVINEPGWEPLSPPPPKEKKIPVEEPPRTAKELTGEDIMHAYQASAHAINQVAEKTFREDLAKILKEDGIDEKKVSWHKLSKAVSSLMFSVNMEYFRKTVEILSLPHGHNIKVEVMDPPKEKKKETKKKTKERTIVRSRFKATKGKGDPMETMTHSKVTKRHDSLLPIHGRVIEPPGDYSGLSFGGPIGPVEKGTFS